MTEQEMVQKIYEVIKLVDCMQHNPSVDFNYLRAKGAYHIIKNQIEHIESENEQLKQTLSKMETVEKELKARLERADEYKHRAEVAERALRNAAPRLNCRGGLGKGFCRVDKCDYYHCNNDEGCVKAHLQQAEKELQEERKDD